MYESPINIARELQLIARGTRSLASMLPANFVKRSSPVMESIDSIYGTVSLESMQFYDFFYKRFGVRRADHLTAPVMPELEALELPKQSILHYVSMSPMESGPAADDFLFRNITIPIQMGHVTENGDSKGVPRKLTVATSTLISSYHIKNRRFRQMRNLDAATRDPNTLLVYNYGFIPQLYHYARSFYSEYYKCWNIQSALWKSVAQVAKGTDRHQFIVCKLPTVLPSIPDLAIGTGPISQKVVKIFSTPESLMLLELWKWFGEQRLESVINHVPVDQLNKVNLIFQESGRWFVMNLGLLNSWRKATDKELESQTNANTKGLDAKLFQRRFLRLTMALFQVRSVASPEVQAMTDGKKGNEKTPVENTVQVVKQDPTIPQTNGGVVSVPTKTQKLPTAATMGQGMDAPDHTAEDMEHDEASDAQLTKDLAELEIISKNHVGPHEGEAVEEELVTEPKTLEEGVMRVCDRLADQGLLSAAQYRHYDELAKTYRTITAPDGKTNLADFIKISNETLVIKESPSIPDIKAVVDKTMLKSSLHVFDSRYITEVMDRDVASMVLNLQNAGIAITHYEKERIEDVVGAFDSYTVRLTPVQGVSTTWRFKLPALNEDGSYMANGVKYRMRKQRGDLPIRKIGPDRVAMTSYYGKVFASRSSKRVNDYGQWLRNSIMAMGLDDVNTTVTNLQPSPVFDKLFKAPRLYTTIAMGFRAFTIKPVQTPPGMKSIAFDCSFDHTKREFLFGKEAIAKYEKDGIILIGHDVSSQRYLAMDANGLLYVSNLDALMDFGTIESILGLPSEKAPVDFAELKVLGVSIPIGVILGYVMGLDKLMKLLKVTPRRVTAGTRVNLGPHEYELVFSDETLVLNREDRLATMVLAGFNEYHRAIRSYSVYEFDKDAVYLNVMESGGAGVRYLREIEHLFNLFIDSITRDLLIEMKEPTNFRGLLLRSCEMLLTDDHPDELDPAFMRIKGYERMAGAVYSELIRAVRSHAGRAGKSKLPIDLHPYAVWKNIAQDPSIAIVNEINPIQDLKEMEAVTYNGVGGRNSRSMTKHTRVYHRNDMGTMSESTVDSSDVGINTYLSADPQFTSLRGMSRGYEIGKTGHTALLSTSALISVGSNFDDPKRVNFVGIQHGHGIACSAYKQSPVRTGYEQIVAHRTSDLFAVTAKKSGKVVAVSEDGIVIQYDDEKEPRGFELGRRFGNASGLTIPHNVISEMKVGQKFKEGEVISYNDGFFEKDLLNPSNVVWKAGIMVKTVLLESTQTLEDASSISQRVATLLSTKATKVKNVMVRFDQSVRKLVKMNQAVEPEDILCIIEDAVTANSGLFDDASLDTLRVMSGQTPQAKAKGTIERIEVYYHGDKEDMSESLRALATASDREMIRRKKAAGKKAFPGSTDEGFRVDGEPLALDTAVIKIYVTADVAAGVGDKGVFCNQMKTVFSEVMTGETTTETGKTIDAVFGQKSIADRIVNSPDIIGTTATLLDVIGKKALAAYRS